VDTSDVVLKRMKGIVRRKGYNYS